MRGVALVCLLALGSAACTTIGQGGVENVSPADKHGAELTQATLRKTLMAAATQPHGIDPKLLGFYASRNFRPVWTGSTMARAEAASVSFTLRHAYRQGLRPSDYPVDMWRKDARPKAGRDAAVYDLILTRSLLRYAHDVRVGRVSPYEVYTDVGLPLPNFDPVAALETALEQHTIDEFLTDLPPPHPGYRRLVAALEHYHIIAAHGGWPHISGKGVPQKTLIERLRIDDEELAGIAEPTEEEVTQALMRFQGRHGLPSDGKLGPATLQALNVPAEYRVKEIEANMERWRWLPRHFESRYIVVNVPDQSVAFMRDGKADLRSKVIIGMKDNRTPILRTVADAVVANPPWDIPDDITAKALLPHLRRNASYLKRRKMVLVGAPADDPSGTKINWRKVDPNNLPYQVQQEPGPNNGLGKIMIDMPNRFDVYLHDTPHKALFTLDDRERSHGCVRVERIDALASLTLSTSVTDPDKMLTEAIATGKTQRLPLARQLPVYMVYWTASAQPDGVVEFRPDLYGRDRPLIAALAERNKKAQPIPRPDTSVTVPQPNPRRVPGGGLEVSTHHGPRV